MNKGTVYALWDYEAQNSDELSFHEGDAITILRRKDESETEWWWARLGDQEGYVPKNLLGVSTQHLELRRSAGLVCLYKCHRDTPSMGSAHTEAEHTLSKPQQPALHMGKLLSPESTSWRAFGGLETISITSLCFAHGELRQVPSHPTQFSLIWNSPDVSVVAYTVVLGCFHFVFIMF